MIRTILVAIRKTSGEFDKNVVFHGFDNLCNIPVTLVLRDNGKMPENNDIKSASKRKNKDVEKRKNTSEERKNTKRLRTSPVLNDEPSKSRSEDEYRNKRDRSESKHKEEHRKRAHEIRPVNDTVSRKRSRSPSGNAVIRAINRLRQLIYYHYFYVVLFLLFNRIF